MTNTGEDNADNVCIQMEQQRKTYTETYLCVTPALSYLCKGVKRHANGAQWVEACSRRSLLLQIGATPLKAVSFPVSSTNTTKTMMPVCRFVS